jgi:hypothetical protein
LSTNIEYYKITNQYATGYEMGLNPGRGKSFFLLKNGTGAHPDTYLIGIRVFPEGKPAGA